MLGKLLKYEIKATARVFISLYLAIVGLSVVNRVFTTFKFEWGEATTICILVALFVALSVMTIVVAIQRFNKNLLGSEGYLMFTLPVSSKSIIISKVLVTLMWSFISGIVAVFAFSILLGIYFDYDLLKQAIKDFQAGWVFMNAELVKNKDLTMGAFTCCVSLAALVSYIEFILTVYASLVTAQLPVFSKHRTISAVAVFIVLTIVVNEMFNGIVMQIININMAPMQNTLIAGIVFTVLISVGLFIGIDFILSKHLNLE